MDITLTQENFDREALGADVPVLVEFWASWCGACRWMAPMFEELAEDVAGKAKVFTVDVEAYPTLGKRFDIKAIPTVIVFNRGEIQTKLSVFHTKSDLRGLLGV